METDAIGLATGLPDERGINMSSVQEHEKCPQCGGIYVIDFDCGTLEEYRYCNRCGKSESYTIEWDEKGKAALDEDGNVKYKHTISFGFGCLAIKSRKGVIAISNLRTPLNDEIKRDYMKSIEDPDVDADGCYLTSWNPDTQEIFAVFGTLPLSYDESMYDEDDDEAETV